MTVFGKSVIHSRAQIIKRSLTRHRLVFVQCGATFKPIRTDLLNDLNEVSISASDLLITSPKDLSPVVMVVGLEELSDLHAASKGNCLGPLRERVLSMVDEGKNVCLMSTAPRVAFGNIPGSSLLEDAALTLIPQLADTECPTGAERRVGWRLPLLTFGDEGDRVEHLIAILGELGTGVLSALDHCLFEIDPRSADGLGFLTDREVEALRGAGLLTISSSGVAELVDHRLLRPIKDALSALLGATTLPPIGLASVSNGLWCIERTIRCSLRDKAKDIHGKHWRDQTIPGGLAVDVLKRARSDTSVVASSVSELRDPLEWLTLGELLDLVTSSKFNGLGLESVIWRRFSEQVVPVRNRLSHMRLLKTGDEEIVSTWLRLIRQQLG